MHGIFSKTDHIFGHKSGLGKFLKTEIISNIVSDHNTKRLGINYREKMVKNTNTWKLSTMFLNTQEVTEEIKERTKKHLQTHEDENTTQNSCSKSSAKREICSNTSLPQETREKTNKKPNLTLKATRKRRTKNPQN